MKKLLQHFKNMQMMGAAYVEPTPAYTDLHGQVSDAAGEGLEAPQRNWLFANDMVHMLDGPEQRAAEADAAFDYTAEARVTLSPSWHGEKVSKANFVERLNAAIDAANRLDMVKKTLFYGRDNNLDGALGQMNLRALPHMIGGDGTPALSANAESNTNIIHGIIGAFTEAGELLEAMRTAINSGQPFDAVNLKEETGDLFWYLAIIAHECGFTFDDAQHVNIAKLRARFPDKFTEYDANNRDLGIERQVLEGGVPRDIAEQALPAHYRTRRMDGERNQDGNAIEAQKPTS